MFYLIDLTRKLARTMRRAKPRQLAMVHTSHVVRDQGTNQIIYQGTENQCRAYAGAFGYCYVEAA